MSGRGKPVVTAQTRNNQALAADPKLSIWVSANAGSGKTFVLTQRVLRLLLTGARPESILCLTYTKAAAAEMRRRVAERLARWATLPEAELLKDLKDVEGSGFRRELAERARTLFAEALETPGGLKIVTIHAFCESVLHRFPLEAGVPFDFTVIEDDERIQLLNQTRERVLAQGLRGEGAARAVETLFGHLSDFSLTDAVTLALSDSRKLKVILRDRDRARRNLRKLVGSEGVSAVELEAKIVGESLLAAGDIREIVALLGGDPSGNTRFGDLLARLDPDRPDAAGLRNAFFTREDKPRKLLTAKQAEKHPHVATQLEAEQRRLETLFEALGAAILVERSEALLDVVALVAERYEGHKRARSLLDFDDLVEKLGDLLQNPTVGPWVQYKLDTGIDHILVDESQDTNPEQWRVVRAIADEFFTGAGAVTRPRSLFAVGDQKQSIYSFQGAEPTLFGETGALFQRRAGEVDVSFRRVPLHTSFRTLPEILQAVDKVSDLPGMQDALLEIDKVHHDTARPGIGGVVTLWPPVQQVAAESGIGAWPTEPAQGGERTAPRQVAERIAREIRGWIDTKRPLANRGVPVTAKDILILVQSRGAVFQEIIRALRREGLPTPGADRLAVSTHIAVLDLLALCDVLLNTADSLQLAALLRSPLFDLSEADLFDLAQPRDKDQTLWQALERCPVPACREAYRLLARWRGELDFERPFEFLTQVLYAEGGLRKFHTRLGDEVDEVFAELLELALRYEQGPQPSLQGFVCEIRQSQVSIKRELAEAGNGIRVMTVHGAKGLEAPIVILADAASKPQGNQVNRPVYLLAEEPGPLLVHASGKSHVAGSRLVRDRVEANLGKEYWRKLYVAMTRAEDELYVTGAMTPAAKPEALIGTWYHAISTALREDSEIVLDAEGQEAALIYPRERTAPHAVTGHVRAQALIEQPLTLAPVPPPAVPLMVTPSSAQAHIRPIEALESLAEQARDAETSRQAGIALHALLQHLDRVPSADWPAVIDKAMPVLLPDHPELREPIAAKAMRLRSHDNFADVFGLDSRGEVPFLLDAQRDGAPIRLVGRMDRLVVTSKRVTVIDFKSDAQVPPAASEVPRNYLTQLGLYALVAGQLYPGRHVTAAILWTSMETLMNLPSPLLAQAIAGFTVQ